jgi:hypothetical protein
MAFVNLQQQTVLALEVVGDAAGILAPASSAMSRIDTALKPRVENKSSAALSMASRMLGFRVIRFAFRSRPLYVCTKHQVQSTNIWLGRSGLSRGWT